MPQSVHTNNDWDVRIHRLRRLQINTACTHPRTNLMLDHLELVQQKQMWRWQKLYTLPSTLLRLRKIMFLPNLKRPPDGFITELSIMSIVMTIFWFITAKYVFSMYSYIIIRCTRKSVRYILGTTCFLYLRITGQVITSANIQYPWKYKIV